jgi:hypothetical protein
MDGLLGLAISVAGAVVCRMVAVHHMGDRRPAPPRPRVIDSLGAAEEGELVKLTGQVHCMGEMLTAPLSGRPCIAYVAAAQAWRCKGVRHPIANAREMRIAPLLLVFGDGEVILHGDCIVDLRATAVSPRLADREVAFLERRKLESYLPSTTFAEAILRDGDRVSVSGVLLTDRGGERGYRDAPSHMRLVSRPGTPLTIGARSPLAMRRARR